MKLFELRAKLPARTNLLLTVSGAVFLLMVWQMVIWIWGIRPEILPTPWSVISSIPEMYTKDLLVKNTLFSVKLNILGYLEATAIALPVGFLIGLFPLFRGTLMGYVNAFRFTPITALVGLFILWFGMYSNMKVQFLTLGILVYLIPMVVQRIDEVAQVYLDTVKTLGANQYQTIRTVFLPDVLSRVFDDIRVIIAVSWTYIIIAEVLNMDQGGIGALAYKASRQIRPDKIFAILLVILIIGFLQDRAMKWLDKLFFPHKYV